MFAQQSETSGAVSPTVENLNIPENYAELNAALIVSHPGHELCVHGWLAAARPRTFVLTDGSGRAGKSRIDSTTKILSAAGARPGGIYGRFSDQTIYAAMLARDYDGFFTLIDELAAALRRDDVDYVVGDAIEGYNPTHDVCRLLIDAAVKVANAGCARPIANFDFSLMLRHDNHSAAADKGPLKLQLSEASYAAKLEAMNNYPELAAEVNAGLNKSALIYLRMFPEIADEIQQLVEGFGENSFRVECLRPVARREPGEELLPDKPFYERYGERMVAAGFYQDVIRHRDHILPFAEMLCRHLDG
jgi:AcrR family transcriptional regulator